MNRIMTGHGRWVAGCMLGALAAHLAWGQSGIVNQIDAALLEKHHLNLFVNTNQSRGFTKIASSEANPRVPAAQHDAARDYIASVFTGAGLDTEQDPFTFATSFGGPTLYYAGCHNVIATLPGADPGTYGYYIIGAYYDTLDRGQPNPMNYSVRAPINPGADMNGSGVAALLSLAEVLSPHTFRSTILFVAFDASQKNFAGSQDFIATKTTAKTNSAVKIPRSKIKGMISLDTIGYNRKGGYRNTVLLYGGRTNPTFNRKRLGAALANFGGLRVVQGGVIQSSDHVPFAAAGIDAMAVMEGGVWVNPNIYTKRDSIAQTNYIDYAYMADITRGVAAFLIQRAGLTP